MPAPLLIAALAASGLLGGFMGGHGRKPIDPAMLARLFGPGALAGDTDTLYRSLAASPMFQQIMSSASSMGTQAGNATNAAFARAGLGSSGIGAVGQAVSGQFGNDLILRSRSNLWQKAQEQALQSLMGRMGLWGQSQMAYQGSPTLAQSFGAGLTGMAGAGLTAALAPKVPATVNNYNYPGAQTGTAPYPGTSVVTAPMRRVNPRMQSPSPWAWRP